MNTSRNRGRTSTEKRTSKGTSRGTGQRKSGTGNRKSAAQRAREQQVRKQKRLLALAVLFAAVILCLTLVRLGGGDQEEPEESLINAHCEAYRSDVEEIAAEYGMEDYTELILALMMQESSGLGTDVMQASEGGFNTEYPQVPGGITDVDYSIRCGIQELKHALEKAGATGPEDLNAVRLALQAYNFGTDVYLDYMEEHGETSWSVESAEAFAQWASGGQARSEGDPFRETAGPWDYGDQYYPEHVLRYYQP